MSQGFADWVGLTAGILTTIAFVPQVLKIHANKSGRDVSMRMFLIFSSGVALWLTYGILISSWPIIVANVATLVLAAVIVGLKVHYARREPPEDDAAVS